MNERKVVVTCLTLISILGVIFGGFAYAYIDKVYLFNQTKSYFKSLGFDISNMPVYTPEVRAILSIVDVASFISIARQNNITTIFEGGYSFIFIASSAEYEYTPSKSIWWIWG
jgi:hypothetical protein